MQDQIHLGVKSKFFQITFDGSDYALCVGAYSLLNQIYRSLETRDIDMNTFISIYIYIKA